MIDIYTEKKKSNDWILQNDLYFNLNTANEEMSENEIDIIRQVDEARLTPDKHIETKYGLGTIRNLSSGCKTLLNIVKHPEKVVCVEECGPNVLKIIFAMDNIKIYMSRPSFAEIPDGGYYSQDYVSVSSAKAQVKYRFYNTKSTVQFQSGTFKITCSDSGTIGDNG